MVSAVIEQFSRQGLLCPRFAKSDFQQSNSLIPSNFVGPNENRTKAEALSLTLRWHNLAHEGIAAFDSAGGCTYRSAFTSSRIFVSQHPSDRKIGQSENGVDYSGRDS